jgi:hypothetical protein
MTPELPENHPLSRLFNGTVQHVLYSELGICDPQLADYLAAMLRHYLHSDDFYPFHDAQGRRIEKIAELLTDAELPQCSSATERRRVLYRHIGDFALFWTGLYPEGIRHMEPLGFSDSHGGYLTQGKRSYAIASELTRPDDRPPARVLRRLSDNFESCVYGLTLCRKEWDEMSRKFRLS